MSIHLLVLLRLLVSDPLAAHSLFVAIARVVGAVVVVESVFVARVGHSSEKEEKNKKKKKKKRTTTRKKKRRETPFQEVWMQTKKRKKKKKAKTVLHEEETWRASGDVR